MYIRKKIQSIGAVAALLFTSAAWAEGAVRLPNGDYFEQVEDIRVKVLGGNVSVSRTWLATNVNRKEYRWFVNPAWTDLAFEYDGADASVKIVDRAGAKFERGGDGIYVLDKTEFFARAADAEGKTTGWRWYDRRGNWMTFTANGKPLAYGDRNDVSVRFERDTPDGPIKRVLDHHGVVALTFDYADGKLASVVDRANHRVQYVWSGNDLVEVIDVLGYRWKYEYSGGLLTKKTDPEQHRTKIEYAGGRAWRITDPVDAVKTWEYDYNRSKRQYTITQKGPEPSRIVKQVFSADGRKLGEIRGTRETYALRRDGDAVDVETDERGATTRKTWDASGNVVRQVNPDGTSRTAKFDPVFNQPTEEVDELGVKTLREYDAKGNPKKVVEAAGLPEQRTLTFTVDDYGQTLTTTIEGATDADDVTTTWTYDDFGNVKTMADGEKKTSAFEYDARGERTLQVDALGKRWTSEYDAVGKLKVSSNPLGETVRYEYDKAGNLTRTTDSRDKATTSTFYPNDKIETTTRPDGGVERYVYEKDGSTKSITDARGVKRTAEYDADGRVTKHADAAGNERVFEYGADGRGNVTRSYLPGFCDDYRYDQNGRLTQAIRTTPCTGDARTTKTAMTGYDAKGRVVSRTDALGRTTLAAYDAFGRVVSVTDAGGGVTRYSYDALGSMVRLVDAENRAFTFTYDKVGRRISESTPLGATVRLRYDAAGNLLERTSPGGERRVFVYDDAGRAIAEKHYAAGSNVATQSIVYTYDAAGNLETYTQSGDTYSRAAYAYDDAGRRTTSNVVYGQGSGMVTASIAYDYWPNGLKKSLRYPDGTTVAFGYNGANQIESAGLPGGGEIRWSDYQWRAARKIVAPGVVATREFDGEGRATHQMLRAIGAGSATDPAGATIMDVGYRYDAVGNLSERTTSDGPFAYTYDTQDRLLSAVPPAALTSNPPTGAGLPNEAYTYDAVGNRRSSAAQPGEWRYDADHRLLTHGVGARSRSYDYDTNGRTTAVRDGDPATSTLTQTYDATDRLREVSRDGVRLGRYQYDPFGRRIGKETAQGVTWFVYGDEGVLAELGPDGGSRRYFGLMPSGGWQAAPLWQARRDGASWRVATYYVDDSGLPQRLIDADGTVAWSLVGDTFGAVETTSSAPGVDNPLRFAGQYRDEETGYHYNWNRNYAPTTGRYLEWDPLRTEGGPNPYLYANANPLRFIDPDGRVFEDRCNCNQDTSGKTLWVSASASVSGMLFVYGGVGNVALYKNVASGEVCITTKTCQRLGLGIGVSASAAAAMQSGYYCGKDMEGSKSCEIGLAIVNAIGGKGNVRLDSINLPNFGVVEECGSNPKIGLRVGPKSQWIPKVGGLGTAIAAGAEYSATLSFCETHVVTCWNTPCACKK